MRIRHLVTAARSAGLLVGSLGASAALALPAGALAEAGQTRSVWSGVYTEEQAVAGEKIYFARCSTCHGDDLGGRESAPALAGPPFLDAWHGKDLRRLLDRITAMPPADPKPVEGSEAIDVLAFLLRTSEMPSGSTALPSDRLKLAEIMFERTKP